jgi:hypothetical protein
MLPNVHDDYAWNAIQVHNDLPKILEILSNNGYPTNDIPDNATWVFYDWEGDIDFTCSTDYTIQQDEFDCTKLLFGSSCNALRIINKQRRLV